MDKQVEEMLLLAKNAMANSYSPYSEFQVGACVLGDDGHYYAGCNVENVSFSITQCAEGSAVGNMITAGAKRIQKVVLISQSEMPIPPCGACRQRIKEFADAEVNVYMFTLAGEEIVMTVGELLPGSFSPEHME